MGRVVILRVWISRLIGQLSSCLVSVHFPGPYFNIEFGEFKRNLPLLPCQHLIE